MGTVAQHGSTVTLNTSLAVKLKTYSKPGITAVILLVHKIHIGLFYNYEHKVSYSREKSWLIICMSAHASRLYLTS